MTSGHRWEDLEPAFRAKLRRGRARSREHNRALTAMRREFRAEEDAKRKAKPTVDPAPSPSKTEPAAKVERLHRAFKSERAGLRDELPPLPDGHRSFVDDLDELVELEMELGSPEAADKAFDERHYGQNSS